MSVEKCERWTFTTWSPIKLTKFNLVDFMIYQKEESDNKVIHYQGYIEFKNEYKMFQVKSIFKDSKMHVEPATESREANIIYCSKEKSYKGHRVTYIDQVLNEINEEEVIKQAEEFDRCFKDTNISCEEFCDMFNI